VRKKIRKSSNAKNRNNWKPKNKSSVRKNWRLSWSDNNRNVSKRVKKWKNNVSYHSKKTAKRKNRRRNANNNSKSKFLRSFKGKRRNIRFKNCINNWWKRYSKRMTFKPFSTITKKNWNVYTIMENNSMSSSLVRHRHHLSNGDG
jgi:hypothetical protein